MGVYLTILPFDNNVPSEVHNSKFRIDDYYLGSTPDRDKSLG